MDGVTSRPLVSIVMIFLNGETYLRQAIDSVLAQTYPHWELLLVDDGSTDASPTIAQRYAAQHPQKIRYLQHEGHQNRGKSTSRNLGIDQAQGSLLTFLDADDEFLPDKLARQVAILQANPQAVMVYGRTRYWYSWTNQPGDSYRDYDSKLGVMPHHLYQPPHLLTRFLQDGGVVPCICGLLAQTAAVRATNGFTDLIQHLYEDQVFLAKLCLHGPVYVEDGVGELYRQHAASSSHLAIASGDYHPLMPNPSREAYLRWLDNYIESLGLVDAELDKALVRAQRPYRHPTLYRWLSPLQISAQTLLWRLMDLPKRLSQQRTSP